VRIHEVDLLRFGGYMVCHIVLWGELVLAGRGLLIPWHLITCLYRLIPASTRESPSKAELGQWVGDVDAALEDLSALVDAMCPDRAREALLAAEEAPRLRRELDDRTRAMLHWLCDETSTELWKLSQGLRHDAQHLLSDIAAQVLETSELIGIGADMVEVAGSVEALRRRAGLLRTFLCRDILTTDGLAEYLEMFGVYYMSPYHFAAQMMMRERCDALEDSASRAPSSWRDAFPSGLGGREPLVGFEIQRLFEEVPASRAMDCMISDPAVDDILPRWLAELC